MIDLIPWEGCWGEEGHLLICFDSICSLCDFCLKKTPGLVFFGVEKGRVGVKTLCL